MYVPGKASLKQASYREKCHPYASRFGILRRVRLSVVRGTIDTHESFNGRNFTMSTLCSVRVCIGSGFVILFHIWWIVCERLRFCFHSHRLKHSPGWQ